MLWRSTNQDAIDFGDIAASFDIEEFSLEDLLTFVKTSTLFPTQAIDKRVLYLVRQNRGNMEKLKSEIQKFFDVIPAPILLELENLSVTLL